MRTVAVIQARTTSTRFPRKVLAPLGDSTVLGHMVRRARLLPVTAVVLAIPDTDTDLRAWCDGVPDLAYVCGSEQDVLGRFLVAAGTFMADQVVRLTADCPLFAVDLARDVILASAGNLGGYTSNVYPARTWPDGCDIEVFPMSALEGAARYAWTATDREHVTPWIQRATSRVLNLMHQPDWSAASWTIDTPDDLARCERMLGQNAGDDFASLWNAFTKETPQ